MDWVGGVGRSGWEWGLAGWAGVGRGGVLEEEERGLGATGGGEGKGSRGGEGGALNGGDGRFKTSA